MKDVTDKLNSVADRIERSGGINGTSIVHFHGSSGLTVVAVTAIIVAVAAVGIVAAWRSADMRELTALRERAAEDRQTIADMQALSRTDRLLLNSLKVDIAKLSAETKPK